VESIFGCLLREILLDVLLAECSNFVMLWVGAELVMLFRVLFIAGQQLPAVVACMSCCRRYAGQIADDHSSRMNGAGPSSSHAAGHSRSTANGSRSGGGSRGASKRTRAAAGANPAGTSTAVAIEDDDVDDDDETDPVTGELLSSQGFWKCKHCTVNNMDLNATTCEVCGLPRPD
jgi:hypothetical protein